LSPIKIKKSLRLKAPFYKETSGLLTKNKTSIKRKTKGEKGGVKEKEEEGRKGTRTTKLFYSIKSTSLNPY